MKIKQIVFMEPVRIANKQETSVIPNDKTRIELVGNLFFITVEGYPSTAIGSGNLKYIVADREDLTAKLKTIEESKKTKKSK